MKQIHRVLIAVAGGFGVLFLSILMAALSRWLDTFPLGKLLMVWSLLLVAAWAGWQIYEAIGRKDDASDSWIEE